MPLPKATSSPRVLVLTQVADDHRFFRCLTAPPRLTWNLTFASSLLEALGHAATGKFPIIVCDREISGSTWRKVVTSLVEHAPRACVLLISPVSDDYLWREVVAHGGYDVVARPLEAAAVNRAMEQAWCFCNAEPLPPPLS
jgi:hypothetical protein